MATDQALCRESTAKQGQPRCTEPELSVTTHTMGYADGGGAEISEGRPLLSATDSLQHVNEYVRNQGDRKHTGMTQSSEVDILAELPIEEVVAQVGDWLSHMQPGARDPLSNSEASDLLTKALQDLPGHPQANFMMGTLLHTQRNFVAALPYYDAALAADPNLVAAYVNKGLALADLGRHEEAIASSRTALSLEPERITAMRTLASSLHAVGMDWEAAAVYERLIQLGHGDDAGVRFGLGLAYQHLGSVADAAEQYQAALNQDPTHAEAAVNLAALHHRYGSIETAAGLYEEVLNIISAPPRAASIDSEVVIMTRNNLGQAYRQLGQVRHAIAQHEAVLSLLDDKMSRDPAFGPVVMNKVAVRQEMTQVRSHIFRAKQSICDWDKWEATLEVLLRDVDVRLLNQEPMDSLLPFDTLFLRVAQSWRRAVAVAYSSSWSQLPAPSPLAPSPVHSGLHVGYLCYDFNDHPTTHLMEGLFQWHRQRNTVKALALSYGKDDRSEYRRSVEEASAAFINLAALSHAQILEAIRASGPLHVLVDLQGHTLGGRAEIAAMRPAPVQASYLIYPGTSGAAYLDYLIADHYVVPPDLSRDGYTEKMVLLPRCYQVNYYERHNLSASYSELNVEKHALRATYGLPLDGLVLANLNKCDKLEPEVFGVWMAVLRSVPKSVLWLLQPSSVAGPLSAANLRREAAAHGVHPSRLVFANRTTKAEHVRRHRAADLFVDTLLYGAHSTATDALRGGLPVLTSPGRDFPSRVGLSLVTHLGGHLHHGLVAHGAKAMEHAANALLTHAHAVLRATTRKLRDPGQEHRLFDTAGVTADMERALHAMWELREVGGADKFHILVT